MELIGVAVRAEPLAKQAYLDLAHRETRLERGLDRDESVIILDVDGGFHAAVVDEVSFTPDDTVYRLRMGARLSADLAADRLSGMPVSVERLQVHDVVDLLGELRHDLPDA
ncbi:MAG: hypothetical protein Q7J48_19835 [Nocardioides sp.]|nr:hypothetical protein [Nocardioides sp.]